MKMHTLMYGHIAAVAINNLVVVVVRVDISTHRTEVLLLFRVLSRLLLSAYPHHRSSVP
jgi:hypothetical protein